MSQGKVVAEYLDGRVSIRVGDLTLQAVDVIVNAANAGLLGGGGVDGAIHRRGGSAILDACREIRRTRYPDGLPVGEAVITAGGLLSAKYVIHTVGPVYGQHAGREPELLANCYRSALSLAQAHRLETIAFPAISTGVFGYPLDEAAGVVSQTLHDWLGGQSTPSEVRLVFFSDEQANAFLASARFASQGS